MKLWQCDWVPSSVADWLCTELDEKGIPGTTYTHTLLSLLHPYFCPHPVPKEPSHHLKGFINFEGISSILNSGHPQELEVLFEEFEDHVHPDADFPELTISEPLKEGSRRSKKRQKRKLQKLSLFPEKIWKVAALQCLLTASDEHHNLESIIEELFFRLKTTSKPNIEETNYLEQLLQYTKQEYKETDIDERSSEPHLTDSSHFPPLLAKKSENEEVAKGAPESSLNWKSLIKNKLTYHKQKHLCSLGADFNQTTIPLNQSFDYLVDGLSDVKGKAAPLTSECEAKEKTLAMEISPNSLEDEALENKAYCFMPILSDKTGQTITNPKQGEISSEPVNNGDEAFDVVKPNIVKEVNRPRGKEKLEEWESAGDLLAGPVNRAVSVDLLGNRLYERSAGSTDTRCSSITDVASFPNLNDDMKLEEAAPSVSSVWDYPASWKESDTESVWNPTAPISQSYDESSNLRPAQHLTPFHQRSIQEDQDTFPEEPSQGLKSLQHETTSSESWPPTQNWYSLASFDAKNDAIFSSAFRCSPHTAYREGTRQDCKMSLPEMSRKNYKNIWSDFNDNITSIQNKADSAKNDEVQKSPSFDQFSLPKKTDEELCDSLRQLRLVEHLWKNPMLIENLGDASLISKSLSCESSSMTFLDELPKSPTGEPILTSEDLYRLKCGHNKKIEETFFLPKIPSGPSGPYVELRHTESSGFHAVVPHEKNVEEMTEDEGEGEGEGEEVEVEVEEVEVEVEEVEVEVEEVEVEVEVEGTEPLTPIGISESSLSLGPSTQDDENLLTSPRTHFRPIRQDSHGSIDEPKSEDGQTVLTMLSNIQDSDLVFQRSGSGTLYLESDLLKGSPKKYMAYREPASNVPPPVPRPADAHECSAFPRPSESPSPAFVPKFKLVNNEKFCQTEGPDGSASLAQTISKQLKSKIFQNEMKKYDFLYRASHPSNIKQIWEEQPKKKDKEAWEMEPNRSTLHYPKWSIQGLNQTDWGNDALLSSGSIQNSLQKNVLMQYGEQNQLSKTEEDTLSKIKFIWHNSKEKLDYFPRGANAPNPVTLNTDFPTSAPPFSDSWDERQSRDGEPGSEQNPLGSRMIVPKSPWGIGVGLLKKKEYDSREQGEPVRLAPRWQLQWEVDQEADEILGGLLPSSPLKASPPYENLGNGGTRADAGDLKFLDFMEAQDQQQPPIEDLDNLEPGWDLNEGFEWGPATEELFEGDDEDGGQEVLVYENAEGQTVVLPVEYFEDSLYDQIFGCSDTPIGGSMPDLPAGQIGDLKKSGLSYKLSRRSRGDKFVPPSRRPCSFFLEGNCRRSDCKFSHDLLTITCRFWEEGSCLKGDTCPFRHGFVAPSRRRNRSEGDQTSLVEPVSFASLKEGNSGAAGGRGKPIPRRSKGSVASVNSFELDSETDFPCLGSSIESKMGSLEEHNFPSNVKVTKVSKKKKKFITVTKSLFKEADGEFEKGYARGSTGGRKKGLRLTLNDFQDDDDPSPRKKGKECESLRKILRKRYPLPPQPPFSHEDGTLSDF